MEKKDGFVSIGATTLLAPIPAVLIGCAADGGWQSDKTAVPNLITVAWAGICCSKPPMLSIAIRPERYSHGLITASGEFTVNLVGKALCHAMDYCGVVSGRDVNKFANTGLTPLAVPGLTAAPAVAQAPAYLCCKVKQVLPLGSHDLFLADIVDARVRADMLDANGAINEAGMELVAFVHGKYQAVGESLGFFGYAVASEAALKRRMPKAAPKQNTKSKRRK